MRRPATNGSPQASRLLGLCVVLALSSGLAGCSSSGSTSTVTTTNITTTDAGGGTTPPQTAPPESLRLLLDSTASIPDLGTDTIEVWICDVPLDTKDGRYNRVAFRLDLTPAGVAAELDDYVSAYFRTLSHGLYTPRFVAGGTDHMSASDTANDCVAHALAGSAATSNAVLAVATAEHTATVPGGFGIHGPPCTAVERRQCSASSTGRAAYVGASDFHPDWGPEPAVDLEEHEIGHLLGWPHSGDDSGEGHSSGLDIMSDSAAPRDFDATRRDGPDTLAVNRIAARWLPLDSVEIVNSTESTDSAESADSADTASTPTAFDTRTATPEPKTQTFVLQPSFAESGKRAIVIPLDATRLLMVDYLAKQGFDSFLPHSGVTVTLVDQSGAACGHADATPCVGADRVQSTKVGTAPFYDMLVAGDSATVEGWSIGVTEVGATATIQVARTPTTG